MKAGFWLAVAVVTIGLLLMSPAWRGPISAQAGGYGVSWWTVDGGGGSSAGGAYTLSGSAGQADAGTLSGGSFALEGGFWGRIADLFRIYLPILLRSP